MGKKYNEEFALDELKKYFNILGRIPTKSDFLTYNIKPNNSFYVRRFGGVEKALVLAGVIEKTLTKEERMNISIKEIREMSEKLNRHPYKNEYAKNRKDGFSLFPLQKHFEMTFKEICNKYLPEYVDNIPEGHYRCSKCKIIKPLDEFFPDKNRPSTIREVCKLCDYIKRNKLNNIDGWTKEEYELVIDNILNQKIIYINELCDILSSRTLNDFIDLLNNKINIGNKPLNIKIMCDYYGKEVIKSLSVYLNNNDYFCNSECYWNWRKENIPKGEDSPFYNRIIRRCDCCGDEVKVTPCVDDRNEHNFCSQECYWKWNMSGNSKIFNPNTKPQLLVNDLLLDLGIKYDNEYFCEKYFIDNIIYTEKTNLMLEINGTFWHTDNRKFNTINHIKQLTGIIRDKQKNKYIKENYNVDILYLWEIDIENNIELCKKLILHYIKNNGILDNYHSFNYELTDENNLNIKDEIIIPYMEWSEKDLKKITKIKKVNFK